MNSLMPNKLDGLLGEISTQLAAALGQNLHSCCVYGSAVRGNSIEGVSDINLLIVLVSPSALAHHAIGTVLAKYPLVDPLIVDVQSLPRVARCFANKFASIQRNYRLIHGSDPFTGVSMDPSIERLLCEQGLRNLRLRATYAFVMNGRQRNYRAWLSESISPAFVQLADVLRLSGANEIPKEFGARIPLMAAAWAVDTTILTNLLSLRQNRAELTSDEMLDWHQRFIDVLDTVLTWIERNWRPSAESRS